MTLSVITSEFMVKDNQASSQTQLIVFTKKSSFTDYAMRTYPSASENADCDLYCHRFFNDRVGKTLPWQYTTSGT